MAKESFKRIEWHLFARQYTTKRGERRKLYYGVFRCRLKGTPREIPLGKDLNIARDLLKELEYRNLRREDFDLDKVKVEPTVEPEVSPDETSATAQMIQHLPGLLHALVGLRPQRSLGPSEMLGQLTVGHPDSDVEREQVPARVFQP